RSRVEAEQAVADLMTGGLVAAEAAHQVVIEDALHGREASLLLFSDGSNYALMPAARDHKRIGEGDTGPNTGGMGAITDRAILSDSLLSQITREIVEPTLAGGREGGLRWGGVVGVGLVLGAGGGGGVGWGVGCGGGEG